ncbi:MAG: dockerin type I repeat-containing protein [Muribaculaceae bacterium]|nr:dockerin type I repeat-containing protein [Muribaculaceae bacterium]
MKKQIAVLLFVALLSAIYVDASKSNGISENISQESVTTPDFTGTYVMFYKTTRTEYMAGYGKYFLSDSCYVNVTIEKDSEVENQYIVKQFARKGALDLIASYNSETGNLEIARQPVFSNRDIVNVNNNNEPITLTPTADGFIINEVWGSLYENGSYFEQGSNSVLMKPNAVMEWNGTLYAQSVSHTEYVKVEQNGNSSELTIVNFGNFGQFGKSIILNLDNDSVFSIPIQLHYSCTYYDDFEYDVLGTEHWYFNAGHDDSWNKLPITGKWTATTMVSDAEWLHGPAETYWGGLLYSEDIEGPFTLTMLSGTIISPFATNRPGDVNGDGSVNVSDVTYLINMILAVIPKDETTGDVNGDGSVNVSDVTYLINIILGII